MDILILFGSLGISMLLFGISIRAGKFKNWWLIQSNPVVPQAAAYLAMPLGIIFLILCLGIIFDSVNAWRRLLDYVGVLFLITVVIIMWRPRWLLPRWLRWLEDNHKDILPLLKREAQVMGSREWGKRIETQEGLEEWVTEIRRKHKV